MSYKAVLFDMDGTLLDTLEDLRDSTNHVLRQMGYPERNLEEMRRFVGNGQMGLYVQRRQHDHAELARRQGGKPG